MKKILFFILLEFTAYGSHLAAAGAGAFIPDQWTIPLEELQRPIHHGHGVRTLLSLAAQKVAHDHTLFLQAEYLAHDIKDIVARYWHEHNITKMYADASANLQHRIIRVTYNATLPRKVLADGNLIAKTGQKNITLYEIANTTTKDIPKKEIQCHDQEMNTLITLPNGDFITSSYDKTIKAWDCATCTTKQLFKGHIKVITGIDSMPNGDLVSGSMDKTARVWDYTSGQAKHIIQEAYEISGVTPLSNNTIITRSYHNQARVWNIETNELKIDQWNVNTVHDLKNGDILFTFYRTPAARLALAQARAGGAHQRPTYRTEIYDWSTGELKRSFDGQDGFTSLRIAPISNDILGIKPDNTLHILDSKTYVLKNVIDLKEFVGDFEVTDCEALDDHTLFIQSSKENTAPFNLTTNNIILDLISMQIKYTLDNDEALIEKLSTGEIAITKNKKCIDIFDLNTGLVKYTIQNCNRVVHSLLPLANGDLIAASSDKTLKIWFLENMRKELFKDPRAITLATLQAIDNKIKSKVSEVDNQSISKKRASSGKQKDSKRIHNS